MIESGVRLPPGGHLPERHAERVDVGGRCRRVASKQLRRAVRERAGQLRASVSVGTDATRVRLDRLAAAEVAELADVARRDDNVGRFDVEMDDVTAVDVAKGACDVVRISGTTTWNRTQKFTLVNKFVYFYSATYCDACSAD